MAVHTTLLALLLSLLTFAAGHLMLDLNPDLGPYQDDSECFPLQQSWHLMHRDFEEGPLLGRQEQPVDQPGSSVNLTISFRDCHTCKVIRHSYINEGRGCSLWVTESDLGNPHPCCEFAFELLCGFHTTYQIYDESCH
ncbi:hypothetical protein MTO96_030310 [Rhipicephalus appendiculatus]